MTPGPALTYTFSRSASPKKHPFFTAAIVGLFAAHGLDMLSTAIFRAVGIPEGNPLFVDYAGNVRWLYMAYVKGLSSALLVGVGAALLALTRNQYIASLPLLWTTLRLADVTFANLLVTLRASRIF